jgi:hypothetical protein
LETRNEVKALREQNASAAQIISVLKSYADKVVDGPYRDLEMQKQAALQAGALALQAAQEAETIALREQRRDEAARYASMERQFTAEQRRLRDVADKNISDAQSKAYFAQAIAAMVQQSSQMAKAVLDQSNATAGHVSSAVAQGSALTLAAAGQGAGFMRDAFQQQSQPVGALPMATAEVVNDVPPDPAETSLVTVGERARAKAVTDSAVDFLTQQHPGARQDRGQLYTKPLRPNIMVVSDAAVARAQQTERKMPAEQSLSDIEQRPRKAAFKTGDVGMESALVTEGAPAMSSEAAAAAADKYQQLYPRAGGYAEWEDPNVA